jgi:predicted kinase
MPCSLPIPSNALVMLVGASASGKSKWARTCFRETEIVSSDRCRALVADDEADQTVNRAAFAVFYEIIYQRLRLGRLTVADSTALSPFARKRLRSIADRFSAPVHAVVIRAPFEMLQRNNAGRRRQVPDEVLETHSTRLQEMIDQRVLEAEGYAAVHYLRFAEESSTAAMR